MAAILTSRFPGKAPELFAYQASIVRAEWNYEGKQWVAYDRQYRREACTRKDLNWSVPNLRLYNEAFTGRARLILRCTFCLQDDHSASLCPRNPARPMPGDAAIWSTPPAFGWGPSPTQDICRNYSKGRCRKSQCRYRHACLSCQEAHAAINCPRRLQPRPRGQRSRSPFRLITLGVQRS